MTEITAKLVPFDVPEHVYQQLPPRPRQEGWREPPSYTLGELDSDVLARLCDEFRAAVFKKAGKPDPAVTR